MGDDTRPFRLILLAGNQQPTIIIIIFIIIITIIIIVIVIVIIIIIIVIIIIIIIVILLLLFITSPNVIFWFFYLYIQYVLKNKGTCICFIVYFIVWYHQAYFYLPDNPLNFSIWCLVDILSCCIYFKSGSGNFVLLWRYSLTEGMILFY